MKNKQRVLNGDIKYCRFIKNSGKNKKSFKKRATKNARFLNKAAVLDSLKAI